jgi:hypothetical protein
VKMLSPVVSLSMIGFVAGDTLQIDVRERHVVLNGITERPDLIDAAQTRWFDLEPGQNLIRLRGTGMVGGQTQLEVRHRDGRI